jgi:Na+-driven multidrug efflux pump
MTYVSIINRLGTLAAAAHGVGISIEAISYLPGAAFQVAAATMAGQYLGAGEPQRATRSAIAACLVGGSFMTLCGAAFIFAAGPLVTLLVPDVNSPVNALAAHLLPIVGVSMPALAISMVLAGALRGAGDTRWPLAITFLGFLGVRLPLAVWLATEQFHLPGTDIVVQGWNLGVAGAWYAMVADVFVRALLILARFWHGGWRLVRV